MVLVTSGKTLKSLLVGVSLDTLAFAKVHGVDTLRLYKFASLRDALVAAVTDDAVRSRVGDEVMVEVAPGYCANLSHILWALPADMSSLLDNGEWVTDFFEVKVTHSGFGDVWDVALKTEEEEDFCIPSHSARVTPRRAA